jgi:hypothetical protein
VSAFTTLLQDHLPPVDTINAILELQSGVAGTYQQSVGTSLTGSEWTIACDRGVATVADSKVTIRRGDDVEEMLITDERTGVPPVIRAWAEGLVKSNRDQDLEPEEAIADLELVCRCGTSRALRLLTATPFRSSLCFEVVNMEELRCCANIRRSRNDFLFVDSATLPDRELKKWKWCLRYPDHINASFLNTKETSTDY